MCLSWEDLGILSLFLCLKATERMLLFYMRHFSFILRNLGTLMVENKMGTLSEVLNFSQTPQENTGEERG